MNEKILIWMNSSYPQGFFCADLTKSSLSQTSFEALSMLGLPLLLRLNFSQLQEFVSRLIEQGVSPNTSCLIPEQNISATLANLLLKSRPLRLDDLFIIVGD